MQNIDQILPHYLKKVGVAISEAYCQKLIVSHPEFPSLLSLSDVLQRLGIPHQVAEINKEDIGLLELPYLLHSESNGGEMIPIHTNADLILNKERLNHWTGIVLQVERPSDILDSQNEEALRSENFRRIISLVVRVIIISFLSIPVLYRLSILSSSLWFSAVVGVIIGYLLSAKDLGIIYKKVETFCNTGTQANCDKILNSAGAKLFGLISLSNMVLAYFLTQLIAIAIGSILIDNQADIYITLKYWSMLSLPIIAYSLFYQKVIAKAWCKLCLIINAILIIQAIIYLINNFKQADNLLPSNLIVSVILCLIFVVVVGVITLIKQHLEDSIVTRQEEEKAYRVKHNPYVFKQLLGVEKVDDTPFSKEVRIGKESAPVQIIMASNLFCNPCKEQHIVASQLVAMYPDKVSISFRFVLSGADIGKSPTSIQYLLMYWLENIQGKPEESENTERMMHKWFSVMNLEKFMTLMPLGSNKFSKESEVIGAAHYVWLNKFHVTMTPTFFVNGYKLPKNYSIGDLKALVPSFSEITPQEFDPELIFH